MTSLTYKKVYQLATQVGLTRDRAIIATAIAAAESGLNPDAVGDVGLQDAKWGPSIGLWQVRSLKAERGKGTVRDAKLLKNPEFNASAMNTISSAGTNWRPWSTYTNGAYRKHLEAARKAAQGTPSGAFHEYKPDPGSSLAQYGPDSSYHPNTGVPAAPKVGQAGFDLPGPVDNWLVQGGQAVGGAVSDKASDVADAVGERLLDVARVVIPYALAVALGTGLIVLGAARVGR